MTYMLDTNICIYAIKKKPVGVVEKLAYYFPQGICISVITLAELEYGVAKSGFREKDIAALEKFLTLVTVKPFENTSVIEYGKIRAYLQKQGTPIGPLDVLIAAHAKSENMILVTNNEKEFRRVPGLNMENWV